MRSRPLQAALTEFVQEAARHLQAELDAGAEMGFDLESCAARRGGPQLYSYRPCTDTFIRERWPALAELDSCAAAERLLECLQGLDRYLLRRDVQIGRGERRARPRVVLQTLLEEVFAERTGFELDPERLRGALAQLDAAAFTNGGEVALIETLHGMGRVAPDLAHVRAPAIGRPELAWALARFEMGCERASQLEALTDYLLALRALLEPEGPASGMLAGRLAVLCATPEERPGLMRRVLKATALERDAIAGAAGEHPSCNALVAELAGHLRAVLRDVVSGHLPPDLVACADGLLAAAQPTQEELVRSRGGAREGQAREPIRARRGSGGDGQSGDDAPSDDDATTRVRPARARPVRARRGSGGEQQLGDAAQTAEILNVPV